MNRRLSGLNDPVMSTRRLAICWPPTPTCGVLCIQGGGRGGRGGGRGGKASGIGPVGCHGNGP